MEKTHEWVCTGLCLRIAVKVVLIVLLLTADVVAGMPTSVKGIYLPAHGITSRRVAEVIHYAEQLGLNAVVLHVKDPYGRIAWASGLELAREIGSSRPIAQLPALVEKLKAHGIWTIAKLDTFADHCLVMQRPELGLTDVRSGLPWKDKNGLYWANPYDRRVWNYIIGLAGELAAMGFDEIQFDYIRFPGDGALGYIDYSAVPSGLTRSQCIGRFLEAAHDALGPMKVAVSVDIFGLTAWKTEDFGVGQVLEAIAPHVDVICPMFYPSHFPTGFLGMLLPGDYPREIMELSSKRIQKRTSKPVRPWIQGFWYRPEEINAQIAGIANAAIDSWTVWNPKGRYGPTYQALALRSGTLLSAPEFYPAIDKMRQAAPEMIKGRLRIVNLTDYRAGYSILSLEAPASGEHPFYGTPTAVVGTLGEGLMDYILKQRSILFGQLTEKHTKSLHLSALLCEDLEIDARRLRPGPIFIDWENGCRFTRNVPETHLAAYQKSTRDVFAKGPESAQANPAPGEENRGRLRQNQHDHQLERRFANSAKPTRSSPSTK